MCVTISPISSMWPTTATTGPPPVPATRAVLELRVSASTAANLSAWERQTAAGASS